MDQKRGRGSGGCYPAPDDAVYHSLCHALDAVQPAADAEKAVNFHLSICNNQKPHLPDAECSARQAGLFYFYFYSLLLAFSPGTATVLQQASPCHRKNTDLIFPITISQAKAAKSPLPAGNGKVEFSQKTVHFKPWNAGYYAAILIA